MIFGINFKGREKYDKYREKGGIKMRKIIIGIIIMVCRLFLFMQTISKAETDPETFECLETLTGHSSSVNSVAFSLNNDYLASGSADDTIKIWNTSDWSNVTIWSGDSFSDVYSVVFSDNNKWLASSSRDDTIKIWDTTDWSEIKTLTGHSNDVGSVAFSPNNKWLASGSIDIKIWDTTDWSEIKTLNEHSEYVIDVAFSTNNEWLASSSRDDTIKIWDTSDWSEIKTLTGHSNDVASVAFSPNNEWLASGAGDNSIKIWDTTDWNEIKTLTENTDNVGSVAFSPNNEWLVSGSKDNIINIWNTTDWSEIKTLTGHSNDVGSVTFSPNNEWLASGSDDDTIKIWGSPFSESFACLETLTKHTYNVNSVAFSPNDEWLASGASDSTIKIWNTFDWSCIENLTELSSFVYSVAFSPNNQWLASGLYDDTIKIWNTTDWSCIKTLTGHSDSVESVAFSPNNQWLVSGSSEIKIWDTTDWSCIITLTEHSYPVFSVVFSLNNQWLASGSFKEIKIWDTSDWSCLQTLTEHSSGIESVAFSPNNQRLASCSQDKTIKIWDTSDWSCLQTLTEHSESVESVAFSQNNQWLVSGSYDETIKIWNTSDWSCLQTLTEHTNGVRSVAFSPNNEWLASGSYGTIKIWLRGYYPDLTLGSSDISLSKEDIITGDNITIYAEIHNIGSSNATNVTVSFYDEEIFLGNDTIDILARLTETASVEWEVETCGIRTIYVKIDEDDLIPEENVTNNIASIFVNISGVDLNLTSGDISLSKSDITTDDTVTIYADIHNTGILNATNVNVSFYDGGTLIVDDNTVALWHMDEGSDDTIYDTTLNNNDGILNGPTWTSGKIGSALSFDGVDDYVDVSDSSSLRITGDLTISVWINWKGLATGYDWASILGKGWGEDDNYGLYISSSSQLWFDFSDSQNIVRDFYDPIGSISTNTWQHIVVIYDDSNNKVSFYNDGLKTHSESTSYSFKGTQSNDLWIGKQEASSIYYHFFKGFMDDIAIHNRALTEEEVKALYEGYKFIGNDTIDILAGETEIASIEWNVQTVGDTTIYVKIDDDNFIPEENETNNIANIDLFVRGVDLTISSNDISFSNENIIVGDFVTIYAEIDNIGVLNTNGVVVSFYYEDELIGNDTIDVLFGETETASIEWKIPSTTGTHTIYIKIDEEIKIMEENEENNIANTNIRILPRFLPRLTTEINKKTTYPNQEVTYTISITNFGGKDDTIYLSYTSTKTWFCNLNRTVVFLKYGETANITLTVIPPFNAEAEESQKIYVTVTSNGNTSRTDIITITTTIEQIHDFKISTEMTTYYGNPGEMANWTYIIENIGNGEDEVILLFNSSASTIPLDWIFNPNDDKKWLEIGEIWYKKYYISIFENAKFNEEAIIVFDVSSDLLENEILGSITLTVKTNKIPNLMIEPETEIVSTDPNKVTSYNITIINNGNSEETFDLVLVGKSSEWVDWNKQELTLKEDEQKEITVNITPEDSTLQGESILKIYAVQENNILSSYDVTIIVNQTHAVEMEIESFEGYIIPGETINYQIKLMNLGNKNDTIKLRITGENSDWVSLDETLFDLDYKDHEYAILLITAPIDSKAMYNPEIKIEAYSNNISLGFIEISAEVAQIYNISLTMEEKDLEVNHGQSVYYEINIINNGNGKDTVNLELFGINSNWGYLNESIFEIGPFESKTITLTVNAPGNVINGEKSIIDLQAIAKNGDVSNIIKTTTTIKGLENTDPIADFKLTYKNKEVTKIRIGEEITFDASSSTDEEGEIVEYRWDFGNGEVRYGEKVDYIYPEDTKPGEYTITLNLTDSNGVTKESQMSIEILEDEEEGNWLLNLILVVVVVIGILIVIMLNKINKNLRDLEKERKSPLLTSEKVGVISIEEERRKEEQKRKEIEMWKPHEEMKEKTEPMINVEEEKSEANEVREEEKETINEKEDEDDFIEKWKKE